MTGVHVVMSTGFYVAATHPAEVGAMTEDELFATGGATVLVAEGATPSPEE